MLSARIPVLRHKIASCVSSEQNDVKDFLTKVVGCDLRIGSLIRFLGLTCQANC
jgi:hypothetical protein